VLARDGRESKGSVDLMVKVLFREPYGHETHLVGSLGNLEIVSPDSSSSLQIVIRSANPKRLEVMAQAKIGDKLPITIERDALHWFEMDGDSSRVKNLTN